MAMSVGKPGGEGEVMVEINTTPLIDVMLVLLIMLIITIPVQTHEVKLDLPDQTNPPPPPPVPPTVVNIGIDFDNSITWNGNPVPDRATLESYLSQAAAQDPQPELHLEPNKLSKYAYTAEVLAEAQRLGLIKIGIIQSQ